MSRSLKRPFERRNNLLLCLDAFKTVYRPNIPIPVAYALAAHRHGIDCINETAASKPVQEWTRQDWGPVQSSFYKSFKTVGKEHPNYGKASGLGAERWWAKVIRGTFQQFLKPQQEVPDALVSELMKRYSGREGYELFPDAKRLFDIIKESRSTSEAIPYLEGDTLKWDETPNNQNGTWKWDKTVVGIISNSDDRVPLVLSSLGLTVSPRRIGTTDPAISEAAVDNDIEFVVISYDVGYEKPNPRIFRAAEDMLKQTLKQQKLGESGSPTDAEDVDISQWKKLYVGDGMRNDYRGAITAGWEAVMIDREASKERMGRVRQKVHRSSRVPVRYVRDLDDLATWNPGTPATPYVSTWRPLQGLASKSLDPDSGSEEGSQGDVTAQPSQRPSEEEGSLNEKES